MTERFAGLWAGAWTIALIAAFIFDMVFGPVLMLWLPGTKSALALGATWGAVAVGPLVWTTLRHS